MDTSGSMMQVIPAEKEVGGAFLNDVLTPKDLAFFMTFDIDVNLEHDFTSSARELRHAMETVKGFEPASGPSITLGPFPGSNSAPGTALYDGLYLGATEKLTGQALLTPSIIL